MRPFRCIHEGLQVTSPTFRFHRLLWTRFVGFRSWTELLLRISVYSFVRRVRCVFASNVFENKCRTSCIVKGAPIAGAERGVASDRAAKNWSSPMGFFWDIHVVATIHKSVFSCFDLQLIGIIQTPFSLKIGRHFSRFKRLVAEVIRESARVAEGPPHLGQARFRHKALSMFVTGGQGQSTSLSSCTTFQTATGPTTPSTHGCLTPIEKRFGDHRCIEMLVEDVLQSCLSSAPPLFKRGRWCGLKISMSPIGILTAVHNVLVVGDAATPIQMQIHGHSNMKVIDERPSNSCQTRHCNACRCYGWCTSLLVISCLPCATCRRTLGRRSSGHVRRQYHVAAKVSASGGSWCAPQTRSRTRLRTGAHVGSAARFIGEGGCVCFRVHKLESLGCDGHGNAHRAAQAVTVPWIPAGPRRDVFSSRSFVFFISVVDVQTKPSVQTKFARTAQNRLIRPKQI